jgi:F-type H+-transporting ATPase subunit delta
MSARASAGRYARALLDVAVDQGTTCQVADDLAAFVRMVRAHADLQRVLTNPAVPVTHKRKLVDALAARAGAVAPVANLLGMLAERNRLALLDDIDDAYRHRLMDHDGVIEAEITTAAPLDAPAADALRARLAAATGRQVTMTTRTDEALIGGVVARIGSTVYDGSVAAQLQKIRTRLGG